MRVAFIGMQTPRYIAPKALDKAVSSLTFLILSHGAIHHFDRTVPSTLRCLFTFTSSLGKGRTCYMFDHSVSIYLRLNLQRVVRIKIVTI